MFNHIVNCSDGFKNSSPLDKGALIKMNYFGEQIFQPLGQDIGRQFFICLFSSPFFSTEVITACSVNLKALRTQRHNLDFQPTNFQTQAKKQGRIQRLSRRFQVICSFGMSAKHCNTLRVPICLHKRFFFSSNKGGISLRSLKNEEDDPVYAHAPPS